MNEVILGIDLGTTNSEVAVIENGKPTIISENGCNIIPSFVGLDEKGAVLVGEPAKNQYHVYPERTVKSIKRKMGQDFRIELGGRTYSPPEISAVILKKLKMTAEAHIGGSVKKAVITVPAFFSDAQRQATRDAGEIAGLDVVKIINEPTAAALAYEGEQRERKRVMVYDLGGGTFDVSVVEMEEGVIEVVASHGNNQLGGDDFDRKIIDHILEVLNRDHAVDTESIPLQAMARIDRAAEAAKKVLSDHPFARIEEEYLLEQNGISVNLSLELSRNDYEEMIRPFIDETLAATHTALNSAGLTVSDIEEILLVGGATRTPLVRHRLEEEFSAPLRAELDPDLCVAAGAAIQAGVINGESISRVLVDVTPYTFGTCAFHELDGMPYPFFFVPVIHKNTAIPVVKSEVFYTMHDNQKAVLVQVYQGENPDALENIKIGEFSIEGLRNAPAGNELICRFSLDANGILHVSAREKRTGLEAKITISNAISRFEADELADARDKIHELFKGGSVEDGDSRIETSESANNQAVVQARAIVEKAERMLDDAPADDRDEMIDLIEAIHDALAKQDFDSLRGSVQELSEILFYLES